MESIGKEKIAFERIKKKEENNEIFVSVENLFSTQKAYAKIDQKLIINSLVNLLILKLKKLERVKNGPTQHVVVHSTIVNGSNGLNNLTHK